MPLLVVLMGVTGFLITSWVAIVQYNVLEQSAPSPHDNFLYLYKGKHAGLLQIKYKLKSNVLTPA